MVKQLSILGSTGSVGSKTLEVVAGFPDRFAITALAAGGNIEVLADQIRRFQPRLVSVIDEQSADKLRQKLGQAKVEILYGRQGNLEVARASGVDLVVSAMVGIRGLDPTMAAIEAGRDVAIANKEILVAAGSLLLEAAGKKGVRILPVDSEHSAVFQCLEGHRQDTVDKLVLTASGGPLLNQPARNLAEVTPEQAMAHPNWDMGPKVSVDSATMMNKGLEVIEAHFLFGLPAERIEIVIHPESVVHALVLFQDGQAIAQLSYPDMKGPIAYALAYPERLAGTIKPLDLTAVGALNFREVDPDQFPAVKLAYQALVAGGTAPAILNAANETAVEHFLQKQIKYPGIIDAIQKTLNRIPIRAVQTIEDVREADRLARRLTEEGIAKLH